MEEIKEYLEHLSINIGLLIAGFFGSFVSASEKKMSFKDTVVAYGSGAVIANYIAPIFVESLGLSDSTKYGFAFALGFSGVAGVKWLIVWGKKKISNQNNGETE